MVSISHSFESHACVQIGVQRGSAGSDLCSLDLTIMEVIAAIDATEVSIDYRFVKISPS